MTHKIHTFGVGWVNEMYNDLKRCKGNIKKELFILREWKTDNIICYQGSNLPDTCTGLKLIEEEINERKEKLGIEKKINKIKNVKNKKPNLTKRIEALAREMKLPKDETVPTKKVLEIWKIVKKENLTTTVRNNGIPVVRKILQRLGYSRKMNN